MRMRVFNCSLAKNVPLQAFFKVFSFNLHNQRRKRA